MYKMVQMTSEINEDLILVLGSGAVKVGQAGEFDYSGSQACKSLKEEGKKVVLLNSNPATIMTDPSVADFTYLEPMMVEVVEKIIKKHKPYAILPTVGGQTALNLAMDLDELGILEKYGVKMLGANAEIIERAENRSTFNKLVHGLGLECPPNKVVGCGVKVNSLLKDVVSLIENLGDGSEYDVIRKSLKEKIITIDDNPLADGEERIEFATKEEINELNSILADGILEQGRDLDEQEKAVIVAKMKENLVKFRDVLDNLGVKRAMIEAKRVCNEIRLPVIIRPSFTLGGTGGGIANTQEEFEHIMRKALLASPTREVQIDKSLLGWKEFELEVMRDKNDNCVIICSIENVDPMGVHTGDSITVAPAMTLRDKEYQAMRDAAIAIVRKVGLESGGANVQFALDPKSDKMYVIEMNPRVSRSSALASKATGFPIAKVSAKLALGQTLDKLRNDCAPSIPASFEPSLDYIVIKMPKFNFRKFPNSPAELDTAMKSVGEIMSIGRCFQEALQKAINSSQTDRNGFVSYLGSNYLGKVHARKNSDIIRLVYDPIYLYKTEVESKLSVRTPERIFIIADALRALCQGCSSLDEAFALACFRTHSEPLDNNNPLLSDKGIEGTRYSVVQKRSGDIIKNIEDMLVDVSSLCGDDIKNSDGYKKLSNLLDQDLKDCKSSQEDAWDNHIKNGIINSYFPENIRSELKKFYCSMKQDEHKAFMSHWGHLFCRESRDKLYEILENFSDLKGYRLAYMYYKIVLAVFQLRDDVLIDLIYKTTGFDKWFIYQIQEIIEAEHEINAYSLAPNNRLLSLQLEMEDDFEGYENDITSGAVHYMVSDSVNTFYESSRGEKSYPVINSFRRQEEIITNLIKYKKMGFSDSRLAELLMQCNQHYDFITRKGSKASVLHNSLAITRFRQEFGINPSFHRIDTCAAEFPSNTNYLYSAYDGRNSDLDMLNAHNSYCGNYFNRKIIVLGSGPIKIGQGVEFDYLCTQACYAVKDMPFMQAIMINCNPSTVSTDYDTSDSLYFEPLTPEHLINIIHEESIKGSQCYILAQFGGQTALNLVRDLKLSHYNNIVLLGTDIEKIALSEDRKKFSKLISKINRLAGATMELKQPDHCTCNTVKEIKATVEKFGYPIIIRPSYVIGGESMRIIHTEEALNEYIKGIKSHQLFKNCMKAEEDILNFDKDFVSFKKEYDSLSISLARDIKNTLDDLLPKFKETSLGKENSVSKETLKTLEEKVSNIVDNEEYRKLSEKFASKSIMGNHQYEKDSIQYKMRIILFFSCWFEYLMNKILNKEAIVDLSGWKEVKGYDYPVSDHYWRLSSNINKEFNRRINFCKDEMVDDIKLPYPYLIDKFLDRATEIDVDAISDGEDIFIAGIVEHVEEAGVHSGDSSCAIPPHSLSDEDLKEITRQTELLAKYLKIIGCINVQFAKKGNDIFIIEVNPRASRTLPFIAKATSIPVAKIATCVMLGEKLIDLLLNEAKEAPYRILDINERKDDGSAGEVDDDTYNKMLNNEEGHELIKCQDREQGVYYAQGASNIKIRSFIDRKKDITTSVKAVLLPFDRFPGTDAILSPEMKSTGEVMSSGDNFEEAFAKSQMAINNFPKKSLDRLVISLKDADKVFVEEESSGNGSSFIQLIKSVHEETGCHIFATSGTSKFLKNFSINSEVINKISKENEGNLRNVIEGAHLVINTPSGGNDEQRSGNRIRQIAVNKSIPYVTTVSAAMAMLRAILLYHSDYTSEHISEHGIFCLQNLNSRKDK